MRFGGLLRTVRAIVENICQFPILSLTIFSKQKLRAVKNDKKSGPLVTPAWPTLSLHESPIMSDDFPGELKRLAQTYDKILKLCEERGLRFLSRPNIVLKKAPKKHLRSQS